MGACFSCLGGDRHDPDEDENNRLLEDPNYMNYGGFGDNTNTSAHTEPQNVQRENEALQKVIAHTSGHLVDVFSTMPQTSPRTPPGQFSTQDARVQQYEDVISKLPASPPDGGAALTGNDWLSDEDDDDEQITVIKPSGPIRGGLINAN